MTALINTVKKKAQTVSLILITLGTNPLIQWIKMLTLIVGNPSIFLTGKEGNMLQDV